MALITTAPNTDMNVENEPLNCIPLNSISRDDKQELQMLIRSPFKLPDDWLVEHRPRLSNPNHIDRYYIDPCTGQKFRSLVSVQRYLNEETRYDLPTERMISENENITFIKSRTAQKCLSPRDFEARKVLSVKTFEGRLTGENACRETPKLVSKYGSGKRSAPSMNSYENPVEKSFSVEEDQATLKPSIQSTNSENFDPQKKIKMGEDDRSSIHNLTRPPTKVSWVLSGPGGFWNPFLDDSIVSASEKAEWSEAFSISINEGVTN
ncbi:methyl-CpG-binding domain-containing protein 7-like, variant 2 [Trifolium repens]|nr:methyl-CpG-binding domain-containing protein 7-like, variant 2 [Trifolium repens]